MAKFVTKYNYVSSEGEIGCEELFVERAGYVPAKKLIENMIYSGQRLVAARKEEFDGLSEDEAERNFVDLASCDDIVDMHNLVREHYANKRDEADNSYDNGSNGSELSVTPETAVAVQE